MAKSERDGLVHRDVMYEARDVNGRIIGLVAVGVVLSAFVINEAVRLSFNYFSRTEFRGAQPVTLIKQPRPKTPKPLLQINPAKDLEQLRQAQRQLLNSYGWVDRRKGIVRVPIDEAMSLAVRRGLPRVERPTPTPSPVSGAKGAK